MDTFFTRQLKKKWKTKIIFAFRTQFFFQKIFSNLYENSEKITAEVNDYYAFFFCFSLACAFLTCGYNDPKVYASPVLTGDLTK
jgi:hypothetical protein